MARSAEGLEAREAERLHRRQRGEPGEVQVERRAVADQRAFVGGDREDDAGRRDAGRAEHAREHRGVVVVAQELLQPRRHLRREPQRGQRRQVVGDVGPGAAEVRHLDAADRRPGDLVLEGTTARQHDGAGQRIAEHVVGATIDEQPRAVGGVDDRRCAAVRDLRLHAERRARLQSTVRGVARHARRAVHVVIGAEQAVDTRMQRRRRARIGTAMLEDVARSTRHAARRRQLLVPEQRLAQQHLVRRGGIPGRFCRHGEDCLPSKSCAAGQRDEIWEQGDGGGGTRGGAA